MVATCFNRDSWAWEYGQRHQRNDPGIRKVFYLPCGAPEREIRLVEVNELLPTRDADPAEPFVIGADADEDTEHKVAILDVTPAQWSEIECGARSLPDGWSLDGKQLIPKN